LSQSDSNQLILVDLHAINRRVLLLIPVLLVFVGAWFAIRWYVGNTVAEYGPGVEDGGLDAARVAVRLAPGDPLTHWRLGRLEQKEFGKGPMESAVRHFAEAVELSPNDYRLWMDFGRALEESGNVAQAEAALRKTIDLAPAYAYPHWFLGNLLLRAGRTDEAFTELRFAAESAQPLRPHIFNLALQVMGDDSEALKKAMGGSTELRAQLTSYLISNQKLDNARGLWNSFNPEEKKEQHEIGEAMIKALAGVKRFSTALEVARELALEDKAQPALNQIFNGGFEAATGPSGGGVFGWQITSVPQAQAAFDSSQYHSGGRSLRLVLKSPTTLALNTVAQLMVLEPQTQYRLEFYVRTDQLRSGGTPIFQIVDEADGAVLGTSAPSPAGTTNWQQLVIEFGTKANSEAVRLRISRAPCGNDPICPIFGTIWYDDFNLQRGGRAARAKPGSDTQAH
jgi:tetratricopeptide (TPR) repeat protein